MATTTAAQRREIERLEYDAFLAQCPSRQLLEQLSSKWVTLLLCALHERPQRYSELSREVAGVSQKMLTQTLRTLERDGLISRDVEATVPVTVTYHGKGQMSSGDVKIDYVNKGNTVEASWDVSLLDDEFTMQDMPRDGGTVTGYFTYAIPKSDEKKGVFAVSGFYGQDEMYMAAK